MHYFIMIILTLFLGFFGVCTHLYHKNAQLSLENLQLQALLEKQTQAIEALALDTDAYVCDLDTMESYIKSRYESVIHEHEQDTCEVKLNELEKALYIYSDP
ncbi:hypothetical protein LS68_009205 [Helicobacter sp. MIT 05-5293]|uniref:hypothetical protein n=1 Tax=unclassified Helicobacter TaxID=2593540 RepID=UPI00051DCD8E|nr:MULTISPECIES: hypothetical protein [unclassified Helicobacter]TLD79839.1 hypothetical protein LS68_009205 [Helicobacter sp. MIT 05-5293]TLD85438.1 hypothetical protein LS69_009545 [Helicobacter sp. MIT 05-5294]